MTGSGHARNIRGGVDVAQKTGDALYLDREAYIKQKYLVRDFVELQNDHFNSDTQKIEAGRILAAAAERDDLLGILRALALGADINEILGMIECPPEAVVRCLDSDTTAAAVSAPVSTPRAMRCSALHIAAYHGHVSSVELLLLNGATKNTRGLFPENEDTSLSLLGATAEEIAIATGCDDAAAVFKRF